MLTSSISVRDAILQRRSIKKFNGKQVAKEDVLAVLADAVWAPNHGNRQPWRFVAAAEEQLPALIEMLKEFAVPNAKTLSEEEVERKIASLKSVGAFLFVIVKEDVRQKERLEDYGAASALIQNAQLLAWDRGIGTCWKTPAFIDHPKFRERLGVQPGERVISILQFGYFDELPNAKERKPLDDILTFFE